MEVEKWLVEKMVQKGMISGKYLAAFTIYLW